MKKRFVALVLLIMMVLSLVPVAAHAEGEPPKPEINKLDVNFYTSQKKAVNLKAENIDIDSSLFSAPAKNTEGVWETKLNLDMYPSADNSYIKQAAALAGLDTSLYENAFMAVIKLQYDEATAVWKTEDNEVITDNKVSFMMPVVKKVPFSAAFIGDGGHTEARPRIDADFKAINYIAVLGTSNNHRSNFYYDPDKYTSDIVKTKIPDSDITITKANPTDPDYVFMGDVVDPDTTEHKLNLVLPDTEMLVAHIHDPHYTPDANFTPFGMNIEITANGVDGNPHKRTVFVNNNNPNSTKLQYFELNTDSELHYPKYDINSGELTKYTVSNVTYLPDTSAEGPSRWINLAMNVDGCVFDDPTPLITHNFDEAAREIHVYMITKRAFEITITPDSSLGFDTSKDIPVMLQSTESGQDNWTDCLSAPVVLSFDAANGNYYKNLYLPMYDLPGNELEYRAVPSYADQPQFEFVPDPGNDELQNKFTVEKYKSPKGDVNIALKWTGLNPGEQNLYELGLQPPRVELSINGVPDGWYVPVYDVAQDLFRYSISDVPTTDENRVPTALEIRFKETSDSEPGTDVGGVIDLGHYTIKRESDSSIIYPEDILNANYTATIKPHAQITVEKQWIGETPEEKLQRPASIEFSLYDGETLSGTYTLNTPQTSDEHQMDILYWGNIANIRLQEASGLPYLSSGLSLDTATNKYVFSNTPTKLHVKVQWVGNQPANTDEILYQLMVDDAEQGKPFMVPGSVNEVSFSLRPFEKADGTPIKYSIKQPEVPGYISTVSAANTNSDGSKTIYIKNTQNSFDLNVIRYVIGTNDFGDIEVSVKGGGKSFSKTLKSHETSCSFDNLLALDKDGKPIEYTVEGSNVPGFDVEPLSISSNVGVDQTLNLVYTKNCFDLTVKKLWDGEPYNGDIEFELYANDKKVNAKTLAKGQTQVVFNNLPFNDADGSEIEYTVKEQTIPGYFAPGMTAIQDVNGNKYNKEITVTNKQHPDLTLYVNVIWNGGKPANEAGIKYQLQADGKDKGKPFVIPCSDAAAMKAQVKLTEPMYDPNKGSEIVYSVLEPDVPGYTSRVKAVYANADGSKSIDIIHTRNTFDLTVNKVWDGEPYNKDIEFELYANGKKVNGRILAPGQTQVVFQNLEFKDKNGADIVYSIKEEDIPGYFAPGMTAIQDVNGNKYNKEITVTNKQHPSFDLYVEKQWVDTDSHPDSVKCRLYADGKEISVFSINCKPGASGKVVFRNLKVLDPVSDEPIVYNVVEDEVPGYSSDNGKTVSGAQTEDTIVIKNTKNTKLPSLDIKVNKIWKNTVEPPESIKIRLLVNGEPGDWVTVSRTLNPDTKKNEWSYTFSNLPLNDADGNKIEYRVEEKAIRNYQTSIVMDEASNVVTITNTRISKAVPTGDESNLGLWLGIGGAALAAVAVVAVVVIKKSKKSEDDSQDGE